MKILAFSFVMLWSLTIHAASPEGPPLDATYWHTLDADAKVTFLRGCRASSEVLSTSQHSNSRTDWIPGLSSQIDAFYQNNDHAMLGLGYAVQICLIQAEHGPQEKVDALLQEAQKEAARPHK